MRSLESLLHMVLPTMQDLGLKPRIRGLGISVFTYEPSHQSVFLIYYYNFFYFETGTRSVAQAGLEFTM